eukprot:Gb_04273 [translate_table: standard]
MSDNEPFIKKAFSLPTSWETTKYRVRKHARNTLATTVEMFTGSPRVAQHVSGEFPRVVVGPIIGKVTTTSVRILIEVDEEEDVTMVVMEDIPSLEQSGETPGFFLRRLGTSLSYSRRKLEESRSRIYRIEKVEKHLEGRRPAVFEFNNLLPGTKYIVEVQCPDGKVHGAIPSSFRTFPEEHCEILNVGVISCNKIFVTKKGISTHSDLWAHLSRAIEAGKIDLLVHLGDQIYGDGDKRYDAEAGCDHDKWSNRFQRAREKLGKMGLDEWKNCKDEICESYREVYRETWQHPPTAKSLANCPNIMIYDDHEIRDNWGDVKNDWTQDSLDFFIAHCAWIVSLEYQRQLHEDVDFSNLQAIKKDHHFHIVSSVGLMFLDIRGSRTFHRVQGDENPYLGSQQWKDIEISLEKGGVFDEVKMLLVCSPAPLVFLHHAITSKAANSVNRLEDFKGHWSVHPHEQKRMIDCLYKWKTTKEYREILILGGDVHCGGHSTIRISKNTAFHQLTTSAIANRPLPKSVYYTLRLAEQLGSVTASCTFTHHHWTRARNYGIVQIKNHRSQDEGEPDFTAQLIRGKYVSGIKMGIKISNHQQPLQILWCKLCSSIRVQNSLKRIRKDNRRLNFVN